MPVLTLLTCPSGVGTLAADSEACARQQYVDPKGFGLGSVYIKGLYREYTDANFTTRKQPNPQHGILGPILHAHVGDTLVIVFKVGRIVLRSLCTGSWLGGSFVRLLARNL